MLTRMLLQSWRHALKRKLLAIITIFLAAGLVSALLAVSIDIGDKMSKELKSYGANILVEPTGRSVLPQGFNDNSALSTQDFLDERELPNVKDIFWRNNIVGFAPLLSANVKAEHQGKNQTQIVSILGTFFDRPIQVPDEEDYHTGQRIISPFWQVQGNWVDDSHDFGEIIPAMIGTQLAQTLGWKIGDQINLSYQENDFSRTLPIQLVGILTTGGNEDQQLVLPLSAVQNLLNLEGKIQGIKVSALTVPENALSRKARLDPDALTAEEYDLDRKSVV